MASAATSVKTINPSLATAGTTFVSLLLTRRCNMSCGHCSVESSPQVKVEPDEKTLLGYLREAAQAGVTGVLLTGGEPMLRGKIVLRLLKECRRLGLQANMTTNGFWGRTPAKAYQWLRALQRAGLSALTVSYDRYHAEFQGHEPAQNIAQAARELNFPININIVRVADEPDLVQIVSPFQAMPNARLRFYDVQPVGRARQFDSETLRTSCEGFCNACNSPSITDDARVVACNGPSYFAPPHSPLIVGSLKEESLAALIKRHREDPVLDTIRTFGPARLRDELRTIEGFADFPFRAHYNGICDLCHHITANAEAVAALRAKLSTSTAAAAARRAAQIVIEANRRRGTLTREYANSIGACRVFWRAAWNEAERWGHRWGHDAAQVLGRADLDWNHLADYLIGSGLARPLLGTLDDAELKRWAPEFFLTRLKTAARTDAFKEFIQREIIKRLAASLSALGVRGTLLKGGAFLAAEEGGEYAGRATGDIDILVPEKYAAMLRRQLLDHGFKGEPDAARTAPHHLAPVSFQGIAVEIHTNLMPNFWGLPEKEMLAHARPLASHQSLSTLSPEGMFLHAGVHASAHLFSHGLKTAWDVRWLVQKSPQLDWALLSDWVQKTRLPRAFQVPVRVLGQELNIALPTDFISGFPQDKRQSKLEKIARKLLFQATTGPFELNPFSKNGVFLLMHDSLLSRARYLSELTGSAATEARRSAQKKVAAQAPNRLPAQLSEAFHQWRQYRRAS